MTADRPARNPFLPLAIDYGPLLVFFVAYYAVPGLALVRMMVATGAFMVAMMAALIASFALFKRVSPMLALTAVLVIVFGGLTLYFRDARFIQMKPTIIYGILSALLGFGLVTGRPLLQMVLGQAYPGLSALGWRKLTINWMLFFAVMAVLNEVVRLNFSADVWVNYKTWGVIPLTLVFALANVPMLTRHGLDLEGKPPAP
ncbi:septation protein A [Sphingomonas sp.]|uniref:septation protein A n=1 Tax=Sphingomonas sp. TaxID=28214 RepID=UPI001D238159|nr:septation protein A [Sphingomonas sp.]MBX9796379.1 septation protein A [Sphingomonas sp.]